MILLITLNLFLFICLIGALIWLFFEVKALEAANAALLVKINVLTVQSQNAHLDYTYLVAGLLLGFFCYIVFISISGSLTVQISDQVLQTETLTRVSQQNHEQVLGLLAGISNKLNEALSNTKVDAINTTLSNMAVNGANTSIDLNTLNNIQTSLDTLMQSNLF